MNEAVIARLKNIIATQLDVNLKLEDIKADTPLFEEGLGLDSIAVMEFITLIEENFEFQFDEDELNMEPFQNLQTLAQFVSTKLETQAVVTEEQ